MDTVIKINDQIIHVFSDTSALFRALAKDFVQRAHKAVTEKQTFSVVLSGGKTPTLLFDALLTIAQEEKQIPWQKIKFFFGDERYVPKESDMSNYHLANAHLFSKLPIRKENIFRIPTELQDPIAAAENYEHTIREVFQCKNNEVPQFDLVYLGLGEDGHTASLMPDSDVVKTYLDAIESKKNKHPLVAALWVSELNMYRITMTPTVLNHSAHVSFCALGANKAVVVDKVLNGPFTPLQYPAQLIRCEQGETVWYLDQAAGQNLRGTT